MSHLKQKKVIHNVRTQVDSFGRKKYKLQEVDNSEESEQNANIKNAIIDTGRHKSMLIGRDESINVEKYIGKIQTNKKKKVSQVFYCDVCQQGFKCDLAYITHLNSPSHNRKLGMNMKVKAVSVQSVASKINSLINKKQQKSKQKQEENLVREITANNTNQNCVDQKDQHDLKQQQQDIKIQQHQENNQEQQQEQEQIDADELAELQMMRQMGLPTAFGSKKVKR